MKTLYLSICASVVVATAALANSPVTGWDSLSDEQVNARMVGYPSTPPPAPTMCCIRPMYTHCGGQLMNTCLTMPNCPAGTRVNDSCGNAGCVATQVANSVCISPGTTATTQATSCLTTGQTVNCTSPTNTSYCDYTSSIITLTYISCNSGDTLCVPQPGIAC